MTSFRPIVVPYAAAIGDDFILMDDNCRPHRANLGEDFFFEEGILLMEWPACSPDMNPIEHVWDALGRRVAGHQIPPPQTLQELERALLEEWDGIPQLVINSLIDSMPQRKTTYNTKGKEKSETNELRRPEDPVTVGIWIEPSRFSDQESTIYGREPLVANRISNNGSPNVLSVSEMEETEAGTNYSTTNSRGIRDFIHQTANHKDCRRNGKTFSFFYP
ncbi:transposable element Tcb2 transposase [Trichonephila clavipes]|nr:transposable element Tcb2 transposase [Trichonephila clavipes]